MKEREQRLLLRGGRWGVRGGGRMREIYITSQFRQSWFGVGAGEAGREEARTCFQPAEGLDGIAHIGIFERQPCCRY